MPKTTGEEGQNFLPSVSGKPLPCCLYQKLLEAESHRLFSGEGIDFICSSQTFTVSSSADKWFVSFTIDAIRIPPVVHPVQKAGVDLAVKCLATVSDGTNYDMPVTTLRAKIKLGKTQWRNRNKVLGNKKLKVKASNNAKKHYIRLSRRHWRLTNIRKDTTQKMTTDLSRRIYNIRIEDLNVSGMIANQHQLILRMLHQTKYGWLDRNLRLWTGRSRLPRLNQELNG